MNRLGETEAVARLILGAMGDAMGAGRQFTNLWTAMRELGLDEGQARRGRQFMETMRWVRSTPFDDLMLTDEGIRALGFGASPAAVSHLNLVVAETVTGSLIQQGTSGSAQSSGGEK